MKNKKNSLPPFSQPSKRRATFRLGKAQARQNFAPLIEPLATVGGTVEITDYGKVAAVMLGYKDYALLLAQASAPIKSKMQLRGSAQLIGDLEEATKEISQSIVDSIEKTAAQL
jgi:PHD/YefM family antitoxin component YafN of YafNO toxin-antitoxin module